MARRIECRERLTFNDDCKMSGLSRLVNKQAYGSKGLFRSWAAPVAAKV